MLALYIGGLRASFLLIPLLFSQFIYANPFLNENQLDQAASSDQWIALLHLNNSQPIITDPNFILSIDDFSPKNELLKTLDFFSDTQSRTKENACKFIARAEYLETHLNIPIGFDENQCVSYLEFRSKAPADEVSIVYASENLTQPSSMLGHSMLAISGMNESNVLVEHGISFFTDLDTINLASILWDTLYEGKKAYFVIDPLPKNINYYLRNEQRNIWQYELNLTDNEKSLLHKHLWELRDLNIDYFFHQHNCATFSLDILSVAQPRLLAHRQDWVTPIDVVKAAEASSTISKVQVYPSNKWKIRMLTDFIEDEELMKVESLVFDDVELATKNLLSREMVKTLNQYSLEIGDIDLKQWEKNKKNWKINIDERNLLEINDYKSPSYSVGDAAYHLSIESFQDEQSLLFGWLPASHALEDDNRQYFGETELKLSEVVLRANLTTSQVDLYRWVIYSAKSLTPRNRFTGGLSGSFSFGFDQFIYDTKKTELAAYLSGSLGVTHKVTTDMGFYYLANVGEVGNLKESYTYLAPEVGTYIYEVFDMKTMISAKREFRLNSEVVNYFTLKQSIFFGNTALVADFSLMQKDDANLLKMDLQYKTYF